MKECDGFVYNTCSAYEPEAIDATRRWLEESSRKLYTIGPICPRPDTTFESSTRGLLATGHEVPEYSSPVQAFMARILASHGENSLIYVSQLTINFSIAQARVMLITKLVNLDVIRKFLVARERQRQIVR